MSTVKCMNNLAAYVRVIIPFYKRICRECEEFLFPNELFIVIGYD